MRIRKLFYRLKAIRFAKRHRTALVAHEDVRATACKNAAQR